MKSFFVTEFANFKNLFRNFDNSITKSRPHFRIRIIQDYPWVMILPRSSKTMEFFVHSMIYTRNLQRSSKNLKTILGCLYSWLEFMAEPRSHRGPYHDHAWNDTREIKNKHTTPPIRCRIEQDAVGSNWNRFGSSYYFCFIFFIWPSRLFGSAKSVINHVYKCHLVSYFNQQQCDGINCLWLGCDQTKRQKWALFSHIQVSR